MAKSEIFVGRKEELEKFTRVLEDPRGQAIVVVGNRGMGKTWLVNRMAKLASEHPTLKCGWVRCEVTPTDSPDSTMALMMDNAFEAANTEPGGFDNVPERKRQWLALFKTFVPRGEQLAELMSSLRRDPAKDTRQQFLEWMELISKRMPENSRAIFVVDPEKYMAKDSDQTWAIVIKRLPKKIKFIFAQRTEDVLVGSKVIDGLDNVVRIPNKMLDTLSEEDVDELIKCRQENLRVEIPDLRKVLSRYEGHPYAVGAALDLVEEGAKLEELPKTGKPTGFAANQWEKIGEKGDEAIKLFEAYAVLEAAVPNDVVECVSELNSTTRKRLQNDKYLRGLLRDEAGGRRIYLSILADYILEHTSEDEKKEYHKRAMEVYRGKLKKAEETRTKPDELAAMRLPEHVLAAEGEEAFVDAFVNESGKALLNLGLLNDFVSLSERSERALRVVKKDSDKEAMVLGNLGLIYQTWGELDKAEEMHKKSLAIAQKMGLFEVMASQYGNLGLVYGTRGELYKAEEMHKRALEISERIGLLEIMANQYGNLGLVYETRGELDRAEEMYKKSLEISERIGLLEVVAKNYGSLGVIYQKRGELDKAEEIQKKSLEISEKLGLIEIIANQYGNLGVIYQTRGELEMAEEMHKKSLAIEERIGRPEGMAGNYGNLGLIYRTRGELDKAEEMHKRALEISERIGRPEGMASQYGNLGLIYQTRGELDKAEEMYKKSLEISERIGLLEITANQYGNLGVIYQRRGELDKAGEMYKSALDIDKKIGRIDGMANDYINLGINYLKKGGNSKAKENYEKAKELYKKIGMTRMAERAEQMLIGL